MSIDYLSIYEREDEEREARTCSGCKVEAGSERDNTKGRRVWWQWACDDFDLMPCPTCRPREAILWLRDHRQEDAARRIEWRGDKP
jgi:hypothetical protein